MIGERHVNMYLFDGPEEAILIDTGFGTGDIRKLVEQLINKPVKVVLTHGHKDHTGAIDQFDQLFGHPGDFNEYDPDGILQNKEILKPVKHGDVINNDNYNFIVLETPGHTPGSISLLETTRRMIFVGDNMSYSPVYMCLTGSSMSIFEQSLIKTKELADKYDTIYANHSSAPIPFDMMEEFVDFCRLYRNHELSGKDALYFDKFPCKCFQYKRASALIV